MSDLQKKLQLKPDQSMLVLNAPSEQLAHMKTALTAVSLTTTTTTPQDAVFLFVQHSSDLTEYAATAEKMLKPDGLLWMAYPKKSSGLETDMNRDKGWETISERWQGIRLIALDNSWSVLRFKPKESEADWLAAQYAKKPNLRPIYDKLVAFAPTLGGNVTLHTRKNYVAFVSNKQFVRIRPSTKTRIDLLLALKGKPEGKRLEAAGRLGDSAFTHKVVLQTADSVDNDVLDWIREAYERQQA